MTQSFNITESTAPHARPSTIHATSFWAPAEFIPLSDRTSLGLLLLATNRNRQGRKEPTYKLYATSRRTS